MNTSVPLFEKPLPHISVPDWANNVNNLQYNARARRNESFNLRQTAKQLRHETDVTSKWDTEITNRIIRDRIFEITTWRDTQRFYREKVQDEIHILKQDKQNSEMCLEHLGIPLSVNSHCFTNRDQRPKTELTHDNLGIELKKELAIIDDNKRSLTDLCHMAHEKENELIGISSRLNMEIQNKDDTLRLECNVRELNRECANVTFKVNPTRIPSNTITEKGWLDCIKNTIKIAKSLMLESKKIREMMFNAREHTRNSLYVQSQQLEHIMRRRIYDIQRARNEMEWQKKKMECNMRKVNTEIDELHRALLDKRNPHKLVETRLEIRTRRPHLELVRDHVQDGLVEQLERVSLSEHVLENKLHEAISTYHAMEKHLAAICRDLENKNRALETDRKLIEIRGAIHPIEESQMERNVGYAHVDKELMPS